MADEQLVGAGEGALSGASAGAIAGPWGAAAGAVVGGTLGYLGSNQKGYSIPWDQYNSRLSQIASYSKQLEGATSQYATAIGSMYNTAYNQYLPNAAAAFAGRGLGIDSGAFGAEAGRTAVQLTSEDMTNVAKMNIANVDKVNTQYGDAWTSMFGAANDSNKAGFNNANANMAGLGQAAVSVGKLGLMGYNGKPPSNPWGSDYSTSGSAAVDSELASSPSWNGWGG